MTVGVTVWKPAGMGWTLGLAMMRPGRTGRPRADNRVELFSIARRRLALAPQIDAERAAPLIERAPRPRIEARLRRPREAVGVDVRVLVVVLGGRHGELAAVMRGGVAEAR